MQQDLDPNVVTPPAAAPPAVESVASPPERQIDPAYVAQLEAAYRTQQAELNKYEPFKDDLAWMTEDESRVEGIRRYRKSYDEASKPQRPPELEELYKHVDESTAPVRAWVTKQELAEQQRAQAETSKFVQDNVAFANRLVAEKKIKPEQIDQLAAYADALANRRQRNVTIEEAFKDMQTFSGAKTEAAAAPVLRADEGATGVPGPSKQDTNRWVTDFHGALTDALAAEKRTA